MGLDLTFKDLSIKLLYLFLVICTLNVILISCETDQDQFNRLLKKNLNKTAAYLVYRATNTKEGNYARQYNITDSLSTHVGIAVHLDDSWQVFHVVNSSQFSALRQQSLEVFYNLEKEKITSTSLWQITCMDTQDLYKLGKVLRSYRENDIQFDFQFDLSDSKKLYCSEFVINVITTLDSTKFQFEPVITKLNPFHAAFLKRDSLSYYPVDIFQTHQCFEKVLRYSIH